MTNTSLIKKILATALVAALVAGGITLAARNASSGDNPAGKMHVVASYYPLYDFARQVGGDKVYVTNVTPAGSEPHDFEPPAKLLADAQRAPVFLYNGTHMEPWAADFVRTYKGEAIPASQGLDLITVNDEDNPTQKVQDPHFWLDPVLARQIVDTIANGLSKADPANAAYYAQRAAGYKKQLVQLDAEYQTGLANCQLRQIVTAHTAFAYLSQRYGFTAVSIAGLSPDAEPSAAHMAALARLVQEQHIQYVFFEQLASPRLADTIAAEAGAKTLVFDPIEGLRDADQKQGKNYLSVQRENLRNLRTALACQ